MAISKHTFEGGMNTDLDESMLQSSMYRYALNIRNSNSEKGAIGTISNAEGNQEISVTLPAGANKVIGAYDDEANDRVIYIVYNSNGDNRILMYDYKNTVSKIIVADSGNVLNLSPEYLISSINVLVGNGTSYLLFTDNYGEPKNIDIEAGVRSYDTASAGGLYTYRKFLGDYDTVSPASARTNDVYSRDISKTFGDVTIYYRAKTPTTQDPTSSITQSNPQSDWEICPAGYIYGNLTEDAFTAIVKAPDKAPRVRYESAKQSFNYLYGNLYQLKYKLVRADGRESAWSPISTFNDPKSPADSLLNVTYRNNNAYNNQLAIQTKAEDLSIYKSIKVAIRRVLNDTSPDDWQLLADKGFTDDLGSLVVAPDTQTKLNFIYDGSEANMPLDTDRATQLMSWIPPKAKAQAITSRNRVVYANFTEGRPYSLDDERSINQNPPTTRFYEKNNPFNAQTTLDVYEYNGSTIAGSPTTIENADDFPGVQGFAIEFPASVVNGQLYSLTGAMHFSLRNGGNLVIPATPFQFSVNAIATSTSTTTLINTFVTALNNNEATNVNRASEQDVDYQLVDASNVLSGSTRYLLIEPAAASAIGSLSLRSNLLNVPKLTSGFEGFAAPSFKRGTTQKFALAYSDDYGRITTAIEHPRLVAANPWWRDSEFSAETGAGASGIAGNIYSAIGARYAQISLEHDAPSWATKYHILKTNSNGIQRSISFPISKGDANTLPLLTNGSTNPLAGRYFFRGYLKPKPTDENSAGAITAASLGGEEFIYIPLNSLQTATFSYTQRTGAPIAYDYAKGDRLRFCYTNFNATGGTAPAVTSDYFDENVDLEIIEYEPEYNCIVIRVNDLPSDLTGGGDIFATANSAAASNNAIEGLMCEIYTPVQQTTNEFYYEIYTNSVSAETANGRYYHMGSEQNQTSAQAAIINLENGDSFLKPRTYVLSAADASLAGAAIKTTYVEDFNYFDQKPSRTWGAGRPNRSVKSTSQEEDITGFLGEVQRPTTLRYSEPFLPDQGFNGLGTINDLNFKDANAALRSIQYLHTEGSRTIVFHENAVGFVESDRAVITTLDNNNMTIGANTPLSDVIYYQDRAGIGLNPESFAYNNARKYFVDVDQGQVCRLSQDGITPISNGMDKYFKSIFRNMITSPDDSYAFGAYDKRTDEYTICLKYNQTIEGQNYTASAVTVDSAASAITFEIGDTSGYDVAVGNLVRFTYPAYDIVGTLYKEFDAELPITAVNATSIELSLAGNLQATDAIILINLTQLLSFYVNLTLSNTLTYSERLKAWTSFHSFNGEEMCSAGLDFVSFRAGKLYIHNDYDNPMRYYGTDYNSYVDVVDNIAPDQIKIWKTAALKATTEDAEIVETDFLVPLSSADTTSAAEPVSGGVEDSRGKVSTCTTPVYKEGQLYFDFMRTGSGTTYSDFIEGDKVRGYWVRTRFKINSGVNKIYKIISVTFDSLMSNYTR